MEPPDLEQRTFQFASDVIGFVEALPKDETSRVIVNKMGIVEEEADQLVAIAVSSIKTAKGKERSR